MLKTEDMSFEAATAEAIGMLLRYHIFSNYSTKKKIKSDLVLKGNIKTIMDASWCSFSMGFLDFKQILYMGLEQHGWCLN